jgi:2-amino-4-hydroxy-6-hydroxymethyldihydropteridine diphosphokinase
MTTREANCDNPLLHQQTEMPAATVYLALGTNFGDREANLYEAARRIAALGLTITRRSSIYETEPVGFAGQDWFLNQVIEAQMSRRLMFDLPEMDAAGFTRGFDEDAPTALSEQLVLLLKALLRVESEMGRRRITVNGPRLIDIDILLCGEINGLFGKPPEGDAPDAPSIQRTGEDLPELILPHPRMHLRRFVLAPLCEIAPTVIHPALQKTCSELLAALDDPAMVRCYRETD